MSSAPGVEKLPPGSATAGDIPGDPELMLRMCKGLAQPGCVSARAGNAQPDQARAMGTANQRLQGCLAPAGMELQPCKLAHGALKGDTRQVPAFRTPRSFPELSQTSFQSDT